MSRLYHARKRLREKLTLPLGEGMRSSMADINCESVRVAAMALADGETPPLRSKEIETHLLICDRCSEEIRHSYGLRISC